MILYKNDAITIHGNENVSNVSVTRTNNGYSITYNYPGAKYSNRYERRKAIAKSHKKVYNTHTKNNR